MSDFEPLTSTVRPLTQSVLTIRIIKSFPYRNVKNIILKDYDIANKTAKDLFEDIVKKINSEGALRPYRGVSYDTLKIYTHAHGSKSMNLVINFDKDDEWILQMDDTRSLHDLGIGMLIRKIPVCFFLQYVILTILSQKTKLRFLSLRRTIMKLSRPTLKKNGKRR